MLPVAAAAVHFVINLSVCAYNQTKALCPLITPPGDRDHTLITPPLSSRRCSIRLMPVQFFPVRVLNSHSTYSTLSRTGAPGMNKCRAVSLPDHHFAAYEYLMAVMCDNFELSLATSSAASLLPQSSRCCTSAVIQKWKWSRPGFFALIVVVPAHSHRTRPHRYSHRHKASRSLAHA